MLFVSMVILSYTHCICNYRFNKFLNIGAHLVPKSFASGLATKFDQAVDKLPLREAARYEFKNQKFTALRFQVIISLFFL